MGINGFGVTLPCAGGVVPRSLSRPFARLLAPVGAGAPAPPEGDDLERNRGTTPTPQVAMSMSLRRTSARSGDAKSRAWFNKVHVRDRDLFTTREAEAAARKLRSGEREGSLDRETLPAGEESFHDCAPGHRPPAKPELLRRQAPGAGRMAWRAIVKRFLVVR